MKLKSTFALLDVMHGRKGLLKRLRKSGPVEVIISGPIVQQWGSDDGESIEFEVRVDKVEVIEP